MAESRVGVTMSTRKISRRSSFEVILYFVCFKNEKKFGNIFKSFTFMFNPSHLSDSFTALVQASTSFFEYIFFKDCEIKSKLKS